MGIDYDYFAADSDDVAASVIGRVCGPGSQKVSIERPGSGKRGFFGRQRVKTIIEFEVDPSLSIFDTVPLRGIDPIVQLGTLEEILTGRPYDDVVAEDRVVASENEGERLVVRLSDDLVAALAEANESKLAQAAVPWSQTEEFWHWLDPSEVADDLYQLANLARRSTAAGQRVYCWACV